MSSTPNRLEPINGASGSADEQPGENGSQTPKAPKKTPATKEEWLAAHLHQVREDNKVLRNKVIEKDKSLLQKDQMILLLRKQTLENAAKVADAENAKVDVANAKLREAHGLVMGRKLSGDLEGECFWTDIPE